MSDDSVSLLEHIRAAVKAHEREDIDGLTSAARAGGASSEDVRGALMAGLDDVRGKLMSNNASIPEFLLCIDTVTGGLNELSSVAREGPADGTTVVIGVVEGDPHDLGKSIIAGVYSAFGYRVVDLGNQVPSGQFVKGVVENQAEVLALSAMMSTTMGEMPVIVNEVKERSPGTVVMLGGAPLDRELAMEYGADGYAESAVTVLEETEAALKKASRA